MKTAGKNEFSLNRKRNKCRCIVLTGKIEDFSGEYPQRDSDQQAVLRPSINSVTIRFNN